MCEDGYCDCHRRCSKCGKLKGPAPYSYPTYPYGRQRPTVYPHIYPIATTAAPQAQWASAGSAAGSTIQYTMKTG